jgi:hypothetical protein
MLSNIPSGVQDEAHGAADVQPHSAIWSLFNAGQFQSGPHLTELADIRRVVAPWSWEMPQTWNVNIDLAPSGSRVR